MRLYYYTSKQFGLKSLWERRLKIGEYRTLNDPFELLPFRSADASNRKVMAQVVEILSRRHGVLCLSERWNSNLMWAHYADKHQGICLGFEVLEGPWLTKIEYVSQRIESPFDLSEGLSSKDPEWLSRCLNVKSSAWRYEREHRCRVKLEQKSDGLYYKPFGWPMTLQEVILGARCSVGVSEVKEALIRPDSAVTISKVRAAHTSFNMVKDKSFKTETVFGLDSALAKFVKPGRENELAKLVHRLDLPDHLKPGKA